MKKLVLVLFLLSTNAWGEWTYVADDGANGFFYLDLATIRKVGSMVKMWSLVDYTKVQGKSNYSYSSAKDYYEYDCGEDRYRVLHTIFFAGNMGNGGVVMSDSPNLGWLPVAPESIAEVLWKTACK